MRNLVIGDMHAPYHHVDTLPFLVELYHKWKCDTITCIGDDIDYHELGRYDVEQDAHKLDYEIMEGRNFICKLVEAFRTQCKYTKPIKVCLGNHNERLLKTVQHSKIPIRLLRKVTTAYKFPKQWRYVESFRKHGVKYFHGTELTSSGVHALLHSILYNQSSCVFGHLHCGVGISHVNTMVGDFWAMNVGCLIDVRSPVSRYGKRNKRKPVIGAGLVLDGVPIFERME